MATRLVDLKEKAFQKEVEKLEEELKKKEEDRDVDMIELQIRIVQAKHTALEDAQHKLLEELLEKDDEDEYLKAEEKLSDFQREYDAAEKKANAALSVSQSSVADSRVHLPQLKLQEFSGDIRHWLRFWAGFEEIDSNSTLSDADKFQYLLQSIPANSTARKCIEGFPVSGKNYKNAVEALKKTYGNKTTLVKVYMRDLLQLAIRNANDKTRMDLMELVPLLVSQIRNLEELGVTSDKCEMVLYPVVESCLPDDVLLAWQRNATYSEKLEAIVQFLNMEVQNQRERALARMDFYASSSSATAGGDNKRNGKKGATTSDIPTASALMTTDGDKSNSNNKKCAFCGGWRHASKKCRKAWEMPIKDRMEIIRKKNLCFCCLKAGHRSADCSANVECPSCKGKHYEVMCQRGDANTQPQQPVTRRMMMVPSYPYPPQQPSGFNGGYQLPPHQFNVPQGPGPFRAALQAQQQQFTIPAPTAQQQQPPPTMSVWSQEESNSSAAPPRPSPGYSNVTSSKRVAMWTLMVVMETQRGPIKVRVFIDPGSEESYIEEKVAEFAGCSSVGEKMMRHQLFGGGVTEPRRHQQFEVKLHSVNGRAFGSFILNAVPKIAQSIAKPPIGDWMKELEARGIQTTDQSGTTEEVQLMFGMDVFAQIKTGAFHRLDRFMFAEETIFGWVVGGERRNEAETQVPVPTTTTQMVTTMMLGSMTPEDLWSLEAIGIRDEATTQTREDLEAAAVSHYEATVTRLEDGRYQCRLPWIEGHRALLSNRRQAIARLNLLTKALQQDKFLDAYHSIITSWLNDGIVEQVPEGRESSLEYFLPHRHVLKENSTTPVRPVFDASSKVKGSASLNECLEKGPNLIELIPAVMARFRWKQIGSVADVKKAFLQISVNEVDREALQFLWWKDSSCREMQLYRHTRVVFGVTSSPFLLAATLRLHLLTEGQQKYPEVAEVLLNSFYVDNSVSSHDSIQAAHTFQRKSVELLATAQMDLRGWEHGPSQEKKLVPVLGMQWDTQTDKLALSMDGILKKLEGPMTKRGLLSAVNAIFDPMGFVFPFTIIPKFLFQKCCLLETKWDDSLPEEISVPFQKWKDQVPALAGIRIPRWMCQADQEAEVTLHIFSDASCAAFSSCVFARTATRRGVNVQLVMCRTRVAPSKKKVTIPRLELLGCLIGVRLMKDVAKYLNLPHPKCCYYTDSSTALAWILNDKQWARFVQNRVDEIRAQTRPEEWRHVPREHNPADLPSRGCDVDRLLQLQWWEGPEWLKNPEDSWPKSSVQPREEDVMVEVRKTVVSALARNVEHVLDPALKFSNYHTSLRVVSIVLRYVTCLKERAHQRKVGAVEELQLQATASIPSSTVKELAAAERCIIRTIHSTSFSGANDEKLRKLATFVDKDGIIRVKSQLFFGDKFGVRCPAVLPTSHPVVKAAIFTEHRIYGHAGVQTTLALLRKRFWILKGRKTVSCVISSCPQCRRFLAKRCEVPGAPLPRDRIGNTAAFEITGVDLLGPLFLFGGEKVWVVLFTCAVYRCVHLEVTPTLSTDGFLRALRRFVARRGRPAKLYSDNGLNFVGCHNLFAKLNWDQVRGYAAVRKMEWIFIPPTAAWWGGWWERLVGLTKTLLRRILGKKVVAMEELVTIMCDVEATLNERPLTYLSDVDPLVPLCPAFFMRDNGAGGLPEADAADAKALRGSARRCQSLRDGFRSRFRKEYLALLQHHAGSRNVPVKAGDVVLIEHEDKKRVDWPWGVVKEIFPGRDDKSRKALIKTKDGEYLRPLQRLFLLETALSRDAGQSETTTTEVREQAEAVQGPSGVVTRAGRKVQQPNRLGF